jgi:hypothetical protein
MVSLADRRRGAEHLERTLAVSERRACQVVEIARSKKRRPSGRSQEALLVTDTPGQRSLPWVPVVVPIPETSTGFTGLS